MTRPDAQTLIAALKAADAAKRDALLDAYAPDIDELATTAQLAEWLGFKTPRTIDRERARPRADGTTWPQPARYYGRTPVWTYRSIALYRASQLGPGNRTERSVWTAHDAR